MPLYSTAAPLPPVYRLRAEVSCMMQDCTKQRLNAPPVARRPVKNLTRKSVLDRSREMRGRGSPDNVRVGADWKRRIEIWTNGVGRGLHALHDGH